ncbi:sterol desaturase family protein [Salinithrix halophila]|uniref:Sterol desaturase family protein n=1 Tax=Salinithrix halophila TaxID=1485204 RepID=A0ABV8JGQ0_9BACL
MNRQVLKEFFKQRDVIVMLFLLIAGLAAISPHLASWAVWVAIGGGMLGYAVSEYMIHRFFFHLKPPSNPHFHRLLKRLHYDHHAEPDNGELLFLPVWYSLPLIAVVGGIAFGVTGQWVLTLAFTVGVIIYLLGYEWMHLVAHRPVKPITPWGRYMKRVHLWHHYKNENYWYGVTNPLLDKALGTYLDEKEAERSTTVKNLEGRKASPR